MLREIVSIYSVAVGPGFLRVQVIAWRHMARVCRQFLDHQGTDAIDRPNTYGTLCIGASNATK